MTDAERQRVLDEEHLRLLRLCYIVTGAVSAVFAFFPLLYVAMGVFLATSPFPGQTMKTGPDAGVMGWFMVCFGGFFFLFLGANAVLKLLASRSLRLRRGLTLCKIAAAVSCIEIPYGLVLGILSFQVYGRPSVAALFGRPGELVPPMTPLPPPG